MLRGLALLLCVAAALGRSLTDDVTAFGHFKSTYGKRYGAAEEAARFNCFQSNMDEVDRLNSLGDNALYGVNEFSDMCASEFKVYHNLQTPTIKTSNVKAFSAEEVRAALDSAVDWRSKGAVTPVKNQGKCGSCWAFSSTGNMEGQNFVANNKLVSLSEEELVQCSDQKGPGHNHGCNGGLMDYAFEWVIKNGGIDSESDYPYTSGKNVTGTCNTGKESNDVAKFSSHVRLPQNEDQIATWLSNNGPVAVAVAAEGWQQYKGGIMSNCYGTRLDHGVLLVGYGTSSDSRDGYWIVKNSWGPSWGEKGYIRLQKGTDQCGLTKYAVSIQV